MADLLWRWQPLLPWAAVGTGDTTTVIKTDAVLQNVYRAKAKRVSWYKLKKGIEILCRLTACILHGMGSACSAFKGNIVKEIWSVFQYRIRRNVIGYSIMDIQVAAGEFAKPIFWKDAKQLHKRQKCVSGCQAKGWGAQFTFWSLRNVDDGTMFFHFGKIRNEVFQKPNQNELP